MWAHILLSCQTHVGCWCRRELYRQHVKASSPFWKSGSPFGTGRLFSVKFLWWMVTKSRPSIILKAWEQKTTNQIQSTLKAVIFMNKDIFIGFKNSYQWPQTDLITMSSLVTDRADVNSPGAVSRRGQQVSAAALEVEVLPVKSAIVSSSPGHTGGWALGQPHTAQQTTTHQRGRLGVWGGERGYFSSSSVQLKTVLCVKVSGVLWPGRRV